MPENFGILWSLEENIRMHGGTCELEAKNGASGGLFSASLLKQHLHNRLLLVQRGQQ
jgi:hypothetical protein